MSDFFRLIVDATADACLMIYAFLGILWGWERWTCTARCLITHSVCKLLISFIVWVVLVLFFRYLNRVSGDFFQFYGRGKVSPRFFCCLLYMEHLDIDALENYVRNYTMTEFKDWIALPHSRFGSRKIDISSSFTTILVCVVSILLFCVYCFVVYSFR